MTTRSVRFSALPYPERYEELLELRRLALHASGQIAASTSAAVLGDPRDRNATTVVGERQRQLVATGRLSPPLPGPPLHQDNRLLVPPVGMPAPCTYLEMSRCCVHPDHHGEGIVWHLVAHCLVAAERGGFRYLLGGCNPEIFPFWRRCGFRTTQTRYTGPNAKDVIYTVIVLDIEQSMAGHGVSPKLIAALGRIARAPETGDVESADQASPAA